jgi:PAS domain S-box-containing protein
MHVFDSVKFPVFDQAGDVIAIGGISIDITERIRKEELIQEQEMMLNLAHIFITDLQGIIIYWNEGSEKMYGYTREEAVGSDVCELLHCSGTTDFSEMRDMVLSSGSSKVEIRQQKKDGTQVDITSIWTVYSTKEGEPKAIIWTNYDQTASVALQRIREEALSRIEKNMLQLMTLNDQIRNPLSIMVAALDLDVPDKDTIITEQIQVIDDIINRLDNGYLESSKVHEFLRRYESIR